MALFQREKSQTPPQIKSGHNLTAQINEPPEYGMGQGHRRYFLIADDFLHLGNFHPKEILIHKEGTKLLFLTHPLLLYATAESKNPGGASRRTQSTSRISVTWP